MEVLTTFPGGAAQKAELLATVSEQKSVLVGELQSACIPHGILDLARAIVKRLPYYKSVEWLKCFIEAIPIGVDLVPTYHRFMAYLLTDSTCGVIRFADERGCAVIEAVAELHLRAAQGDYPTAEEWDDAAKAATKAATKATAKASQAAWEAAEAEAAWEAAEAEAAWEATDAEDAAWEADAAWESEAAAKEAVEAARVAESAAKDAKDAKDARVARVVRAATTDVRAAAHRGHAERLIAEIRQEESGE